MILISTLKKKEGGGGARRRLGMREEMAGGDSDRPVSDWWR